jgi:hypothetical protein
MSHKMTLQNWKLPEQTNNEICIASMNLGFILNSHDKLNAFVIQNISILVAKPKMLLMDVVIIDVVGT